VAEGDGPQRAFKPGGCKLITLRRAVQRHHDRRGKREAWFTFQAGDRADSLGDNFAGLELFSEASLPPGARVPRYARREAEIVTYVREGALAYEDSKGRSVVICAGEFQRMTPGRGVRCNETNASRTDRAHTFQIGLNPSQGGFEPGHEQKRFSAAERRGLLCIVASPDARRGSLRVHQDARIYSTLLDPGQHVVHELSHGRSAWLHVVEGEVRLGDVVLTTGDGAGIADERAVSITAQEESEILLVDLGGAAAWRAPVDPRSTTGGLEDLARDVG
jgi:redox-sensitive bicupin YhaK (pirin superfamily)